MERSLASELMFQFCFRTLQPVALGFRQIPAGPIDIESQHRQRRAIGASPAAGAAFGGTLEGGCDLLCTRQLEYPVLEIKRVAFFRDPLRPALW